MGPCWCCLQTASLLERLQEPRVFVPVGLSTAGLSVALYNYQTTLQVRRSADGSSSRAAYREEFPPVSPVGVLITVLPQVFCKIPSPAESCMSVGKLGPLPAEPVSWHVLASWSCKANEPCAEGKQGTLNSLGFSRRKHTQQAPAPAPPFPGFLLPSRS